MKPKLLGEDNGIFAIYWCPSCNCNRRSLIEKSGGGNWWVTCSYCREVQTVNPSADNTRRSNA